MAQAEKRTVHTINPLPKMNALMEEKAPHLNFIHIPYKKTYTKQELASLQDKQPIEILIIHDVFLGNFLEAVDISNLKWVHLYSSGAGEILKHFNQRKIQPSFPITRNVDHRDAVSEYAISQILAHRRQLRLFHDQQKSRIWKRSVVDTSGLAMSNFSVVILGVGEIGGRIAKLCKALGMTVFGVKRTLGKNGHECADVDYFRTTSDLELTLSEGDYVVNTLPSTPLTRGLLDNDKLRACQKKKSVFINVGRGDVISESSIVKALSNGWVGAVIVDVLPVEPLPPSSPLWTLPGLSFTPHTATDVEGNLPLQHQMVDGFLRNFELFTSGQKMNNLVDPLRGY